MAKGNVGNLLQHFVILSAAERLVRATRGQDIAYVDCFSMAPWETLQKQKGLFGELINSLKTTELKNDVIAAAFRTALSLAPEPGQYPNSAVLIRAAFPQVEWHMRLHDIKEDARLALASWGTQTTGTTAAAADFSVSPLVRNAPVADDQSAMVVLDPYQVVARGRDAREGDLPVSQLRWLLGDHGLAIARRPATHSAAPAVITLFSYTESAPDATDRAVRSELGAGWQVARVKTRAIGSHQNTFHQAWWIASSEEVACPMLASMWRGWTGSVGFPLDGE